MPRQSTNRTGFPPPQVRMALRVSRDSGRTWGAVSTVLDDAPLTPLANPNRYPPCECPRCDKEGAR